MQTLKEFIFQEIEKKGFVLDDEIARFIKETKGELVKRRGGIIMTSAAYLFVKQKFTNGNIGH